jgi:hypothetical protein
LTLTGKLTEMKYKLQASIGTYFKRFFRKAIVKSMRLMSPKERRAKYPKKLRDAEKIAIETFLLVLKDPESSLYVDINTQECFLRSDDSSIYLFLEAGNLKIVNTIFGYDISLDANSERFLSEQFKHELAKRRRQFKKEALEKVQHSLKNTFEKLSK